MNSQYEMPMYYFPGHTYLIYFLFCFVEISVSIGCFMMKTASESEILEVVFAIKSVQSRSKTSPHDKHSRGKEIKEIIIIPRSL